MKKQSIITFVQYVSTLCKNVWYDVLTFVWPIIRLQNKQNVLGFDPCGTRSPHTIAAQQENLSPFSHCENG